MTQHAIPNHSKRKSFFYISFLNVISALAVIILHANGAFWNYRNGHTWEINNIIECVFYFAVPVFFMLTGATLFDYRSRYDTKTFFKRRFIKILIPFVFWSIFGVFYYVVIQQHGWDLDVSDMFNALFSGSYVGIFWFFPPLICIYLAIPLFSAIKGNKTKLFKYLAIVGFILNIAVPFLINLFNYYLGTEFLWKYNLSVIGDYLIYPVIGYLLHNDKLTKKMRITVYVLAIVSLVVHILGTYYVSHDAGAVVRLFKGYLNVPCFFYSIGVFVFIKQLSNSEKLVSIIKKPVLFLQKYSFAFYLLHFFVLGELARQFEPLGLSVNNLLYVFIAFILTIPICILLTFLIRKIPVVGKYILP